TPNTTTNALTLAASVTGSLDEPGEEDRYTFTGVAGQRLYYDALDADNDPINVQLISPSGAIPFINGNSDSDVGPFTLTETGTYTLIRKHQRHESDTHKMSHPSTADTALDRTTPRANH